jgi:hypothetical protein
MTTDTTARLVGEELRELLGLVRTADGIELKLTVPEGAYLRTSSSRSTPCPEDTCAPDR